MHVALHKQGFDYKPVRNLCIFMTYIIYLCWPFSFRYGRHYFCWCRSAWSGSYCCYKRSQFSEKWRTLCHFNKGNEKILSCWCTPEIKAVGRILFLHCISKHFILVIISPCLLSYLSNREIVREFVYLLYGVWIQYLYKAKSVLYSWFSFYLFSLLLGKLHWFNSRTCCCICWRSEKDASRENETTRAVNIGAIWKRSCCSCRHIQVLQSTCFFNCRFTPVSTSISCRSKWNSG